VLAWRRDLLPFAEGTFDRILSPFAVESAYEPYDALMTLNRCLKETGTLYTGYTNIRYHRVLRELKRGAFPVRGDRHLYAKPEIVRLLNDTLYKEIHFFAGERDDDPAEAAAWSSAGFANVSNDLMTRYVYKVSSFAEAQIKQSGTNTLSVKLKGLAGDTLSITAGGMSVKVRLKTSSPEAVRERRAFYVRAGLMIAGVIVIFALIGRKMKR